MYGLLDGLSLSRPQVQAKAEAQDAAYAGQLDGDSSHDRGQRNATPRPIDTCDWKGDPPEDEDDDLSHACNTKQQPFRPVDASDKRDKRPERHGYDYGKDDRANLVSGTTTQPAQCNELAEPSQPEHRPSGNPDGSSCFIIPPLQTRPANTLPLSTSSGG